MAELNDRGEVRAAGGVVWRRNTRGDVQLLLVHRPKYDDWTLPKGKAEPGEDDEACAVREVQEETGLVCRIERSLAEVRYVDGRDRPKVARYWLMAPVEGRFQPHDEVDDVSWASVDDAHRMLTYDRDCEVVSAFERVVASPVLLIRHADAGSRSSWPGPDEQRPLSTTGVRQAEALVVWLASFPLRQVLSSPAVRCVDTVAPLAAARGLPVDHESRLAEGAGSAILDQLGALLDGGAALCTHADVIPQVVAGVPGVHRADGPPAAKASIWILDGADGCLIRASYLPPPGV